MTVAVARSHGHSCHASTATGSNAATTPEQAKRSSNYILIPGPLKGSRFPVVADRIVSLRCNDWSASGTKRTRAVSPIGAFMSSRPNPRRRKTGTDKALVFRQRGDGLSVLIVEPDMQRVEIGLLALAARRLRDRGDAILVEQPFQRHL